jgi:hypothetical protein
MCDAHAATRCCTLPGYVVRYPSTGPSAGPNRRRAGPSDPPRMPVLERLRAAALPPTVGPMGDEARRAFAVPPASGEFDGIDLALLDPSDPDERRMLIIAEHPDLAPAVVAGRREIHVRGEPISPGLHISLHEIVTNQLWHDDPPEVWRTAKRLSAESYDRHEVLHMLASVVSEQTYNVLKHGRPFDADRMRADLERLPESWERARSEIPQEQHFNRAERRAAQRRSRH